jgi:hypothetical protein
MARKGKSFEGSANLPGPKQRIVRKRQLPKGTKEIHVPPTRLIER